MEATALARMGGLWGTDLLELSDDIASLDGSGRWAVAIPYAGEPVLARFATWSDAMPVDAIGSWTGPDAASWASSMDEVQYVGAVEGIREAIRDGDVYQANICRIMSALLPDAASCDVAALALLLDAGNPSPYGGFLRIPESRIGICSASPELFVSTAGPAAARVIRSGPIKGTGRTVADLSAKDVAENVMIVDLVRNDLSRVSRPGSVHVPVLLQVQEHPGLVHLVSYVEGTLAAGIGWPEILEAAFPPGSVTGAPKIAALRLIAEAETAPRDFYCGAFGWVDADTGESELAVAIRTFWIDGDVLRFGTGAGITWGSDSHAEWRETELKAARLVSLANGSSPTGATWQGGAP